MQIPSNHGAKSLLNRNVGRWALPLTFVTGPIVLGASIYLCFGVPTLRVFNWLTMLGLNQQVQAIRHHSWVKHGWTHHPQTIRWILHHVPDGCWVYAWTMYFASCAANQPFRPIWIIGGGSLACAAEILQTTGLVPGTFDPMDLAAYCAGFLGALITVHRVQRPITTERDA